MNSNADPKTFQDNLSAVAKKLDKAAVSLRQATPKARLASSANVLLIANSSTQSFGELFLRSCMLALPGRIFRICVIADSDKKREPSVTVSQSLVNLDVAAPLYCELVEVYAPKSELLSLQSMLLHNLLPGTNTQVILDPSLDPVALQSFTEIFKYVNSPVVVDSELTQSLESVLRLQENALQKLGIWDLSWVKLSAYRDIIRQTFQLPQLLPLRAELRQIRLNVVDMSNNKLDRLLLGFITNSLHTKSYAEPSGSLSKGFRVNIDSVQLKRFVEVQVLTQKSNTGATLPQLQFFFENESGKSELSFDHSITEQGSELAVHFKAASGDVVTLLKRNCEQVTPERALWQVFAIGESFANYSSALRQAVEIEKLVQ